MTDQNNVLQVRADIGKNRLYCTIAGTISKADLDRFYTDVRFNVSDLQPDFDVITDLTNCHLAHLGGIPTFRKIMAYLAAKGVREVVRVINPRRLLYRQAMNLAGKIQSYSPIYVNSMEEAEALLDQSLKRAGLRFNLLQTDVLISVDDGIGEGKIINLSTSGCALRPEGASPAVGRQIVLTIPLHGEGGKVHRMELEARVVRHFEGGFGAAFTGLTEEQKAVLWQSLVEESQRQF